MAVHDEPIGLEVRIFFPTEGKDAGFKELSDLVSRNGGAILDLSAPVALSLDGISEPPVNIFEAIRSTYPEISRAQWDEYIETVHGYQKAWRSKIWGVGFGFMGAALGVQRTEVPEQVGFHLDMSFVLKGMRLFESGALHRERGLGAKVWNILAGLNNAYIDSPEDEVLPWLDDAHGVLYKSWKDHEKQEAIRKISEAYNTVRQGVLPFAELF